jgi:hypothetical protein
VNPQKRKAMNVVTVDKVSVPIFANNEITTISTNGEFKLVHDIKNDNIWFVFVRRIVIGKFHTPIMMKTEQQNIYYSDFAKLIPQITTIRKSLEEKCTEVSDDLKKAVIAVKSVIDKKYNYAKSQLYDAVTTEYDNYEQLLRTSRFLFMENDLIFEKDCLNIYRVINTPTDFRVMFLDCEVTITDNLKKLIISGNDDSLTIADKLAYQFCEYLLHNILIIRYKCSRPPKNKFN